MDPNGGARVGWGKGLRCQAEPSRAEGVANEEQKRIISVLLKHHRIYLI